ncbi:MAG: sulfotransferase family 2 domain-containing protein [Trueperaceae bacterium]|nr:sulfotransferase family 2 domain-containing protein [Trueperaceae bacterium]
MISHHYKCVFIHIPKSAGTSIGTKLGIYASEGKNVQDHRTLKQVMPLGPGALAIYRKEIARDHYIRFRAKLEGRPFLTREQYQNYFKFTFVRNPWARVHSWYRNVLNDANHLRDYQVPADASLDWFIKNRLYTVQPQLEFIRDWDGTIPLDFIGRFENLHEDFSYVCQKLGISDYTLPERVRIGTPLYVPEYTEENIDIVAKAFREEIEHFDFKFGESLKAKLENQTAELSQS